MTEARTLSGRYRITGHLARGGMADVYEAEDLSLGRGVAIKTLHSNFAGDEAFVARFRREAQAAANLTHPNIVGIYDWGEDGDSYYIVMELIRGRTLRDVTRSEGPLLPRRAAEIAAEAAAALSVAHQAGVYHRDIKPGNIMLGTDGSVKVTDFGIARALDDSEELTRTGAVIGTATYFSPEQAQGLPADERSDVYSLGVVLYELVAGQPPFSGESPVAVAYQHVSEYAAPVSEINPDVPADLEAIIDKAMEKDPADRYASAEDFRADLLRFLVGETPMAVAIASAAAAAVAPMAAGTQVLNPPPATVPPDETARVVAATAAPVPRSQASYIVAIFGLLLVLTIGIIILASLLRSSPTVEEPTLVAVPDLAGLPASEAFEELQNLDLKVRQRDEPSSTVAQGFVIGTEPGPGSEVDPGSFVTVVVSTGPQQFAIPNVIDLPRERAEQLLEADGFTVGQVRFEESQTVPENTVIDQTPRPGTEAPPDTPVDLVVSSGPFALEVPDVAGLTLDEAQSELDRVGFTNVTSEDEFSEDVETGLVTRTDPAARNLVPRDTEIVIFISSGPEPFAVPDVVGQSREDARATIEDLGLVFLVSDNAIEVSAASGLEDRVAAQTPPPGTDVVPGDEVVVQMGVLRQVTVPDLVGRTRPEARQLLDAVGLTMEVTGETEVDPDSGLENLVATQNRDPGTTVPDGSTVQVTIGVLPPPPSTTTTTTTQPPPTTEPPPTTQA